MNKLWMLAAAIMIASSTAGFAQQTTVPPSVATVPVAAVPAPVVKPDLGPDWPNLRRYAADDALLSVSEPGRVVFYGDSITDSWNLKAFFPGKPYVNRGISGQTTPQMLVRFTQDVVALHPAAVVILAGTNDIAGNTGYSTNEMIEDNFKAMTAIAKANGIRVVLASVLPVADYPWKRGLEPANRIIALNVWLKAYCASEKLTYLDYFNATVGPDGGMKPGISSDGVHPNGAGQSIMAPLAQQAVDTALAQ